MRRQVPFRTRTSLGSRLRLSGLLIAVGLLAALPTFFWTHPVSFVLFAGGSGLLVVTGMLLYLLSVVTDGERGKHPRA